MGDVLSQLRPDQLASLMEVGAGRRRVDAREDQPAADELATMLYEEVLPDDSHPNSPRVVLGRPCDELRSYCTIAELLFASALDLIALTALKDYAKRLPERKPSGSTKAVATAIYYAAIAAALVSRNEKITEHGYEDLAAYFAELANKPWMTADLRALFEKARDTCQNHAGEEGAAGDA